MNRLIDDALDAQDTHDLDELEAYILALDFACAHDVPLKLGHQQKVDYTHQDEDVLLILT
jgi:hypothetical protein